MGSLKSLAVRTGCDESCLCFEYEHRFTEHEHEHEHRFTEHEYEHRDAEHEQMSAPNA